MKGFKGSIEDDDKEIQKLERMLGISHKNKKKDFQMKNLLQEELQSENMFELFSCVDSIFKDPEIKKRTTGKVGMKDEKSYSWEQDKNYSHSDKKELSESSEGESFEDEEEDKEEEDNDEEEEEEDDVEDEKEQGGEYQDQNHNNEEDESIASSDLSSDEALKPKIDKRPPANKKLDTNFQESDKKTNANKLLKKIKKIMTKIDKKNILEKQKEIQEFLNKNTIGGLICSQYLIMHDVSKEVIISILGALFSSRGIHYNLFLGRIIKLCRNSKPKLVNRGLRVLCTLSLFGLMTPEVIIDVLNKNLEVNHSSITPSNLESLLTTLTPLLLKPVRQTTPSIFLSCYSQLKTGIKTFENLLQKKTLDFLEIQKNIENFQNEIEKVKKNLNIKENSFEINSFLKKFTKKNLRRIEKPEEFYLKILYFENYETFVKKFPGNWIKRANKAYKEAAEGEDEKAKEMDFGKMTGGDVKLGNKLEKIAERLKLKTYIQKRVFMIIMNSADYIEAVSEIMKLGTKGTQNKELMQVLIKSCLFEKNFNPYYSMVTAKLLKTNPKLKFSLNICIWETCDNFAEASDYSYQSIENLGAYMAELINEEVVDFKILKFLDRDRMKKVIKKIALSFIKFLIKIVSFENLKNFVRSIFKNQDRNHDILDNLRLVVMELESVKEDLGRLISCESERKMFKKKLKFLKKKMEEF